MDSTVGSLQKKYLLDWARERGTVRLVGHLCTLATLGIIGTLFFFLIYLGNPSLQLLTLSFFVVLTNFSRFIIYRLFLVPRFFLALRSEDEAVREAAWQVIDAHREEMLRPIVTERREPSKPSDIAALDIETVAGWNDLDKVVWWERFARRWLIGWLVALGLILLMLFGLFQDVMHA